MYYRILFKTYERAAKKMCLACQDFIEKGSKILDLGCGSGIVGNQFKEFFYAEVIGVDIIARRILPLPFEIIDGKHLPFPEKYFDVILINYVLHHAKDPTALLKNAKRVGKKIIIFEDLPEGLFSKLICRFHGLSYSTLFKNPNFISFKTELPKEAKVKMKTKFSFASEKNWEKIFKEIGLNVIFKKRINNFLIKKELFICEPRAK